MTAVLVVMLELVLAALAAVVALSDVVCASLSEKYVLSIIPIIELKFLG